MRTLAGGLVGLVLGAVIGTFLTSGLVAALSTNAHDKSLEVAMTAFFFGAPIGGIVGAAYGIWRSRKIRSDR